MWIRLGDDNTRYFFSLIKHKKLQHAIVQITDEQHMVHTDKQTIADTFVGFYQAMLGVKEKFRVKAFKSFLRKGYILTTQ